MHISWKHIEWLIHKNIYRWPSSSWDSPWGRARVAGLWVCSRRRLSPSCPSFGWPRYTGGSWRSRGQSTGNPPRCARRAGLSRGCGGVSEETEAHAEPWRPVWNYAACVGLPGALLDEETSSVGPEQVHKPIMHIERFVLIIQRVNRIKWTRQLWIF